MEPKLYDKTGREILVGDVLKVFHFIGARRKRYHMYKQVVGQKTLGSGTQYLVVSHLTPRESSECYYEALDGRVLNSVEIVQGFGADGISFEDRPKIKRNEEK